MTTRPLPGALCHVGLQADDPVALAAFYRDVLGLEAVGGSDDDDPFGASAFLSGRPEEESHEIVFFKNPANAHIAFRVKSLADLRAAHAEVVGRGIAVKAALNHGVSLAFYFDDPEGNMVEIYWATGLRYGQPYGHAIDLGLAGDELLRGVAELAERIGKTWSPPSR